MFLRFRTRVVSYLSRWSPSVNSRCDGLIRVAKYFGFSVPIGGCILFSTEFAITKGRTATRLRRIVYSSKNPQLHANEYAHMKV